MTGSKTHPTAGFALKENKFDGVYVGRLKGNQLVYAGKVDHGFDPASTKELAAKAAHPQNATLHQEDSAPRRMGGTFALGGDRISGQISRRKGSASGIQRHQGGPAIMTVWLYVDTRYRVGHPDHIKAFADPEAAERSFKDNDAEGVAFEYEVIGR
jgi:hypothetical protein